MMEIWQQEAEEKKKAEKQNQIEKEGRGTTILIAACCPHHVSDFPVG